jgi:hypothetical protein
MDTHSGGVGGQSHVPADDVPVEIETDEVGDLDHGEVDGERVHPEVSGDLGVADGDVASDAFGVAGAAEDAEGGGEMLESPCAVVGRVCECGDTWGCDTLMTHRLKGGKFLVVATE